MSTENKFREFWIYRNEDYAPTYACDFNQRGFVPSRNKESIHVIEIAALEQLKAELEKVQQDKASNDSDYLKLSAENNTLKSKLEIAKKGLEFYAGGDKSDIELDIFDHFKCHHNGNSEFDSKWLCKPARQALSEIGEG